MAGRTDTKFFTNEDGNSLYERFNHTLKNAQYFDSLVGYFRTSGFYRLYKSFENIDKIRILIGLNVDRKTLDLLQETGQQKFDFEGQAKIRQQYKEEVKSEFETSDDTEEVDLGVNKFRELLRSGKIEMKACREQNIHAKVYITRYGEDMPIYGSVITGSSNFTENGLNAQYEFNVELKDTPDVEFALEKFEKLWENAVPITEGFCWNNVLNPNARLLKTKLKQPSVNDVGSMSLMTLVKEIPNLYFVILLNSNLIFDYYREFINCTVNVQINDIRKLPIVIPTNEQIKQCKSLFDEIILLKKVNTPSNSTIDRIKEIDNQFDKFVNELYLI